MKPGDLIKNKTTQKYGMFIGYRTFDKKYTCSEVMWYPENKISTIQSNLIETIKRKEKNETSSQRSRGNLY